MASVRSGADLKMFILISDIDDSGTTLIPSDVFKVSNEGVVLTLPRIKDLLPFSSDRVFILKFLLL